MAGKTYCAAGKEILYAGDSMQYGGLRFLFLDTNRGHYLLPDPRDPLLIGWLLQALEAGLGCAVDLDTAIDPETRKLMYRVHACTTAEHWQTRLIWKADPQQTRVGSMLVALEIVVAARPFKRRLS